MPSASLSEFIQYKVLFFNQNLRTVLLFLHEKEPDISLFLIMQTYVVDTHAEALLMSTRV